MTREMPVVFAAHGAPMLLDDAVWLQELANWAGAMPRPRAILMISAHWETSTVSIGTTSTRPLIYDFFGFPERYYEIEYPAPGARIRRLGGSGALGLRPHGPRRISSSRAACLDRPADLRALCARARRHRRRRTRCTYRIVSDHGLLDGRSLHPAFGPARLSPQRGDPT